MCQVVIYKRLKTVKKYYASKSGRSYLWEVVVYETFQLQGFDWEKFGVLDRWSLMGGGRLQEVVAHGDLTVHEWINKQHKKNFKISWVLRESDR